MQVIRIGNDNFSLWRDQIAGLLNCSVRINFPGAQVEDTYGSDKCRDVETFLKNGTAIVFAAIEGKMLAGWVWCHQIHRLDGARIHIAEIAVAEEWHRRGVGSKLIDAAEQYAAENGYNAIDLLVTSSNLNAVCFYEKAGFKPERYLMKKNIKKTVQAGENIDA